SIISLNASVFPDIESDSVRPTHRLRVQVGVVRHEKLAGADHGCARLLIEDRRPKIWLPLRLLDLLEKPFVFARANDREIGTRWIARSFLVKINRNFQFLAHPLSELLRAIYGFFPSDVAYGNERANIR